MKEDLSVLIHRYLEGLLDEAETREFNELVRTNSAFRGQLARAAYDHSNLRELMKSEFDAADARPASPPHRRFDRRVILPLAAAAVLLLAVVVTLVDRTGRDFATVNGGRVTVDGLDSNRLRPDARIVVTGGDSAEFRLRDGSTAELSPGSELVLKSDDTIELARGTARFKIAGGSRRIVTPLAALTTAKSTFYVELRVSRTGSTPYALYVSVMDGGVEVEEGPKRIALAAGASRLVTRGGGETAYDALLRDARVTLVEALELAAEGSKAALPYHADLETESGRVIFAVDLVVGGRTLEVKIDARDGKILKRKNEDDEDEPCVEPSSIPLARAVTLALEEVPGRAVEAEFKRVLGQVRVDVTIVQDGQVKRVRLDGRTGEVENIRDDDPEKDD